MGVRNDSETGMDPRERGGSPVSGIDCHAARAKVLRVPARRPTLPERSGAWNPDEGVEYRVERQTAILEAHFAGLAAAASTAGRPGR